MKVPSFGSLRSSVKSAPMLLNLSSRSSSFCAGGAAVVPAKDGVNRRIAAAPHTAGPCVTSSHSPDASRFSNAASPTRSISRSAVTSAAAAARGAAFPALRISSSSQRSRAWQNVLKRLPTLETSQKSFQALLVAAAAAEGETAPANEAALIDGKAIAEEIKREIAAEVKRLQALPGAHLTPGLAVVLVGDRKDSQSYVRMKKAACAETGITSFGVDLPADVSEEEVVAAVKELNDNPDVHGVLVQLPLPKHINAERVLSAVSIDKDVDGFHPINIGQLAMAGRKPLFVPCTPKGCIELLIRSKVPMEGKRAVVIGRSNIVGTPAAMLLQRNNATVTVVHSRTKDPPSITREADIVIAAAGVPNLVRANWLKPGCVVIDVGINPVDDPSSKRGYRLVGDVCFEEAKHIASAITPVPGGVGPMTIAMLLSNTLEAAKRSKGVQLE
ncbi:hypothetical protein CLOM_g280 [Closterium sp. NIES-68]|nr:hypothetical protein CLOM_g280 [Closterium sp. NIES-68]GJP76416.1 hypothetical protein CLOP_g6866 [Closterium sp. NIES-67]